VELRTGKEESNERRLTTEYRKPKSKTQTRKREKGQESASLEKKPTDKQGAQKMFKSMSVEGGRAAGVQALISTSSAASPLLCRGWNRDRPRSRYALKWEKKGGK